MGGPGRGASFGLLLLVQLPGWYLWAAATPVVLILARRWTPTSRWIAPHAVVASAFAIIRTVFGLLFLLPSEGVPVNITNLALGLRGKLPFGFLLDLLIYAVILAFGAVALREQEEAAQE